MILTERFKYTKMIIEVCANSLESAINAEKAGATRIELCSELGVGGITPSLGLIKSVLQHVSLPVHVLIRPRSGDFTYSEFDFKVMLKDIEECAKLGVSGIVSGVLNQDFSPDMERTGQLINASEEMSFTFHRAFDWTPSPDISFLDLQELGVHTILSSGQKPSAESGISLLCDLKEISGSCQIMPGGGISAANVQLFKEAGFKALHFSGSLQTKTFDQAEKINMNSEKLLRENYTSVSDVKIIKEIIQKLK